MGAETLFSFLIRGGPVMWAIALVSVFTVTLILWKAIRLYRLGAWGGRAAEEAVAGFCASGSISEVARGGLRSDVVGHAIAVLSDPRVTESDARDEIERYARRRLTEARSGLRALDVVANVAPLLGLLGTVLGMIEAFQVLQDAGAQADPSDLAGGIWQALLTTAAGMAVAIPAALALGWFESVVDTIAADFEDLATRLFLARPRALAEAAE